MQGVDTQPREIARSSVRRESLTDQTVRAIRDAIFNGEYALGQKLRESDLVSRFDVSSSVILEALHVLQGEGVIVTRPYCGRSVFSVRAEEAAELTVIRASLESYAAYLAAQKMTPEVADRITAAARRFIGATPSGYGDWVDCEMSFHRLVWEVSGNEWLVRQLNHCSAPVFVLRILGRKDADIQVMWAKSQNREAPRNPTGHQLLARSLVSGRPGEARRNMLLHILWERGRTEAELFGLPLTRT